MLSRICWLLFSSLLFAQASATQTDLTDFRAEITATRHGTLNLKVHGEMYFRHTDTDRWELGVDFKGGPLKSSEKSTGEIIDNKYRPLSYQRNTRFLFTNDKIRWNFNWDKQRLSGKIDKDDYQYSLNDIIHDPNSFQIPLRRALINGDESFKFKFMRHSRPSELVFEVIGEELLTLEDGRVHTLILKQIKPLWKNEKKLIWVAKDFDYIPMKFTTYRNDKVRDDLTIKKLWINNQAVSFN